MFAGVSGFDVDKDGVIYASYLVPGMITATDAATGLTEILGEPTSQTYGAGLSPDEQTVYLAGYSPLDPTIYQLERDGAIAPDDAAWRPADACQLWDRPKGDRFVRPAVLARTAIGRARRSLRASLCRGSAVG